MYDVISLDGSKSRIGWDVFWYLILILILLSAWPSPRTCTRYLHVGTGAAGMFGVIDHLLSGLNSMEMSILHTEHNKERILQSNEWIRLTQCRNIVNKHQYIQRLCADSFSFMSNWLAWTVRRPVRSFRNHRWIIRLNVLIIANWPFICEKKSHKNKIISIFRWLLLSHTHSKSEWGLQFIKTCCEPFRMTKKNSVNRLLSLVRSFQLNCKAFLPYFFFVGRSLNAAWIKVTGFVCCGQASRCKSSILDCFCWRSCPSAGEMRPQTKRQINHWSNWSWPIIWRLNNVSGCCSKIAVTMLCFKCTTLTSAS